MALLIGVITAALLCIAVLVTVYVQRNKPKWPYVEVSEGGIAAAMDKIREPLLWQNIYFFATYKGPPTHFALSTSKHARYYELASPQRIIRWRYQPRLAPQMTTRPELDQQAYDRWHQQLLGYIRERTSLPLVDLDRVPVQAGKK
ncbi:hypothetical protein KDH_22710 [Dictyobacter sp. S3.2.2.5]|uniref:Uncharacterized protein n=2 Tax=Dictyobacter halimunensis TaxID=3026934 RepID=A0ABQ6FQZ3_9CHLR|nr:hypothetical protein KDH_22710 [Dictyobacter sp. S3.2.2.5]